LFNGDTGYNKDALRHYTVGTIKALEISKHNGLEAIVNTAILGAYVRLTGITTLERLLEVIEKSVPTAVEQNLAAAQQAYEKVATL
jgi:Pyruvate/2-oxoacid:ferredoxin oxidoreductase gamma subunit